MRVAVVGAGVGGLTAIKCCRDEGLDVVCFESRNDLGGLWNYTETVQPGQSNVARSEIIVTLLMTVLDDLCVLRTGSRSVSQFRHRKPLHMGGFR